MLKYVEILRAAVFSFGFIFSCTASAGAMCGVYRGGMTDAVHMVAAIELPSQLEGFADSDSGCILYCEASGARPGDKCIRQGNVVKSYTNFPPFVSPWTLSYEIEKMRMRAELKRITPDNQYLDHRGDYASLALYTENYAKQNASYLYATSGNNPTTPKDSISGQWPKVLLTKIAQQSYFCGHATADLVNHSAVWTGAVRSMRSFVQVAYPYDESAGKNVSNLSPNEISAIQRTLDVAMNGLSFFIGRDKVEIDSTTWAFNYKWPVDPKFNCTTQDVQSNVTMHGNFAPLNYIAAASHLATEIEWFFSLPDSAIQTVYPTFDSAKIATYRTNFGRIAANTRKYIVSQITKDSVNGAFWKYVPVFTRTEDNPHAPLTINLMVRLVELGKIPRSDLAIYRDRFVRQYSTGPASTYSHFDSGANTVAKYRGTIYATKGLAAWSELLSFDCSLTNRMDTLLSTPVPDDKDRTKFYKPSSDEFISLKYSYSKKVYCGL